MRNTLQARLTRTYIGLAVVPLVVLGLLITWQGIVFQDEAIFRQDQLARQVSVEVNNFFRGIEEELLLSIQLQGGESLRQETAFTPLFKLLTHAPVFEELTYVDENARVQSHETRLGVRLNETRNYQALDAFQIPFVTGKPYFGLIQSYPATGEPVAVIAVQVNNQLAGQAEGVLIAVVRLVELWQIAAETPLNTGQSVYILDPTGRVIAHPNRSVALRETRFFPLEARRITSGFDSSLVLLATEPVVLENLTLTVVVEQSIANAFELPLNIIFTTLGVALITLGTAIYIGLRSVRQIVHPIQELASTARAIRAGEWQQQVQVKARDELGDLGEAFNLMVTRLQTSLSALEEEVAERIHAEQALREAEARYRTLVEHLPAITYIDDATDEFGKTHYISPQVETLLGYTQAEWLALDLESWKKLMHPDDLATFLDKYTQCYAEGQPLEVEYRMFSKAGDIFWFQDQAFRLKDQEGQPWIIQGVMVDITERKKAEEEIHRLNAELELRVYERTAQLEAANKELESFTYSISHDLRTPLRGIIGFSSLLLNNTQHQIPEDNLHYLNRVRENAQRMGQLVDDLLKFSRLSRYPIVKQAVQPAHIAQEALDELIYETDGRKMQITIGTLPPCLADPSLLRQVFSNLISNAIKYTRNKDLAEIEIGWEFQNNDQVYYVRDNGVGFDMQYVDKLFGVFQRLHSLEDFEGTGVGLAITHRIIHRHGGRIWAEAKPGMGATFYFTLG